MTDWKEKYPIGSQWKTRGGEMAIVVHHDCEADEGEGNIIVWLSKGMCTSGLWPQGTTYSNDITHEHDLIAPWTEPRKGEFWVNVYAGDLKEQIFYTREQADMCAGDNRLDCVHVTWTEGEGLVDEEI